MDVLIIVCVAGSIAMLLSKMIPSRVELDRKRYDREMQTAYQALREGRQLDRSRSEFTANRQLAWRR